MVRKQVEGKRERYAVSTSVPSLESRRGDERNIMTSGCRRDLTSTLVVIDWELVG